MSDTLTEDAQVTPSVEETSQVSGGSGSGEEYVPASRFNGLMSSFNRVQDELAARNAELDTLRQRLEALESQQLNGQNHTEPEDEEIVSEPNQVDLLVKRLWEKEKKEILERHPEAKPFADLIVTDDPAEFESLAATLAERAKGLGQAPAPTGTPAPEAPVAEAPAPETPPTAPAGGGSFDAQAAKGEKVLEALRKRDFAGYLRAKWEEAEVLEASA